MSALLSGYRDERTGGFIYLTELPADLYFALFDRLYLPREEWRIRLRAGRRDFARFVRLLPVYTDPISRKKYLHGADIRAALQACVE